MWPPNRRRGPRQSQVAPADEACIEVSDNSGVRKSAIDFFQVNARHPAPEAAQLTEQFIRANLRLTALLDVRLECHFDGRDVFLAIYSGNAVGAIPLLSPRSARHDFTLVIQPRFEWGGIGPLLAEMGWRIAPSPLKLPLLRRSDRKLPAWVLSSMVLIRLEALLRSLTRKFEMQYEHLDSPRGRVDWNEYARCCMPAGNFLSLPCYFPDLQDDRLIRGAIRHTVDLQVQSLQTQRHHGAFVHRLIEFAQSLLQRVQNVPSFIPTPLILQTWMQRPLKQESFLEGLQAMEWTVEQRGLAGLSVLEGLPWRMPMDSFFEAWVETLFARIARRTGAQIKTGRQRQTIHPINWQPAFIGSQKSLVPDIVLEWDSVTMIVDAKYKRHWEELNERSWSKVGAELREDHRSDLFQILAYCNLAATATVIACLTYPCSFRSWQALEHSGRLIHKATIIIGTRCVHLWLTAVPMVGDTKPILNIFSESIRSVLAA